MKKFACALLALITAFSLCACDNDDDDRDRSSKKKDKVAVETTEATEPVAEPTEEESEALEEYICTVSNLKTDAAALPENPEPYQLEYIQDHCHRLMEYAYATKWAKTERAAYLVSRYSGYDVPFDPATDWDPEAVLAQFNVVKDVALYRTEKRADNLGNESMPYKDVVWHYNAAGNTTYITNEDQILFSLADCIDGVEFSQGVREYDKNGRLSKITSYSGDTIDRIATYTYNEKGQLVNLTIRENTQTYEITGFTYDEKDRLTRVDWSLYSYDVPHAIIYTYNDDNTVAMVEHIDYVTNDNDERFIKHREAMEYTYKNGVAVSGTYCNQNYSEWINMKIGVTSTWVSYEDVDTYTFSYDNAGRLVEEVVTHGGRKSYNKEGALTNESVPSTAITTYTTVYGDYYVVK